MNDPVFRQSVNHTIVYTLLFVPLSVGGSLALAMLLNARIRFSRFYRIAVFIPVATSTVATAIIFNWLLDPTYGVANYMLGKVAWGRTGSSRIPTRRCTSIVAMTVWGWLGFDVIVYLAALQGVPQELIEAAGSTGPAAGRRSATWSFPLLAPATLFLVVWSTINALQLFDEIYVTTRGGPLHATTVHGLLPLQPGVPVLPRRLRGGHRLRAVRRSPGAVAGAALARQPPGALPHERGRPAAVRARAQASAVRPGTWC